MNTTSRPYLIRAAARILTVAAYLATAANLAACGDPNDPALVPVHSTSDAIGECDLVGFVLDGNGQQCWDLCDQYGSDEGYRINREGECYCAWYDC